MTTDAQTEARAIALKIAAGVIGNIDAEHVERFGTKVIATALAAKDAKLIAALHMLDLSKATTEAVLERAERAEAQLAEARKALEPFAKASGLDGHQRDNEPLSGYWADIDNEGPNAITFGHLRAARRARTGGKKDG